MTNAQLLMTLILVQQGMLAAVWLGVSALGLERRPAAHWGLTAAVIAGCLALAAHRGSGLGPWLGYFVANVCGIAAYALLHRGVLLFCGRPPRDAEHLGVVAIGALALAGIVIAGTPTWAVACVTSVGVSWGLLRAGWTAWEGLKEEFGRGRAVACSAPLLVLGGLFALRAALAPVFPEAIGRSVAVDGVFNAAFGVVTLAMTLVQNLALGAMVVARAVLQLRRLSDQDALTGVLNRRGLAAQHGRERAAPRRGGLALLVVDLDHFKRINDTHGHEAGDAALVAVARTLAATVRPGDTVARTGGEEFCVLLRDADAEGQAARAAAERVRLAVRATRIEWGPHQLALTCSVGVAWTADGGEPLQALARRADGALYRAKDEGRDRVVMASLVAADLAPGH